MLFVFANLIALCFVNAHYLGKHRVLELYVFFNFWGLFFLSLQESCFPLIQLKWRK